MNTVHVRDIVIGEGRPKICVPIVGKTRMEILAEASRFSAMPVDLVEWRVDWYTDVFSTDKVIETAKRLRETLGNIPVLFTFWIVNSKLNNFFKVILPVLNWCQVTERGMKSVIVKPIHIISKPQF